MTLRKNLSIDDYFDGIKAGDITTLSRAITLVESKNADHKKIAREVLKKIMPLTGKAKRIGISGTPGVGKSTFIESFGNHLIEKLDLKVAVLAVDPTSYKSGGSILGDKTRMNKLSSNPKSFIRPTPSGLNLGGVASKTRESLLLCEAAGFDVVIVETVGVGQSEITVSKLVDFFFVLMQPGAGDDLQGIKRGILELADLVAINKADGDKLMSAKIAKGEYESALHILRSSDFWIPPVTLCSGLESQGIEEIWEIIVEFYLKMSEDNRIEEKRDDQVLKWLKELFFEKVNNEILDGPNFGSNLKSLHEKVLNNKLSVIEAAESLFNDTFKDFNK
jgi:LAO/AO transport system kinase